MKPETVTTTVLDAPACLLGEGPAYDAQTDTAWWFDILGKGLFEHVFATGRTRRHDLPFMASQLSVIDAERQMIFADTGLFVRDVTSGNLTLHTAIEADNAATRSNDGRVHPCGALWMGTMGREAETGLGAIYWFYRGELRQLYKNISIPNAICFSADGATAYYTDTPTGLLMRVATDPATGLPIGEPAVFHDTRATGGGPDGAVVDAEGCLWNARWGGGRLDVYGPDGAVRRSFGLPVSQPTCPLFVGSDAGRMLVTSARKGAPTTEDRAGTTLLLGLPVRGRHDARLALV
ncbi:gluconolactonase [Aureimonas sp. SA4125]|uniref:SMP-30/gluconolactonase/LRE family protein n=1 Tax=Aureimonas sp. SA4125 TaxID=2826993 RepID=UPI001CC3C465|nr:SMP-30/gluconolactonase/LRE family protein [Aureimonas sp. SA4125]BDA84106.1 gluconolactonase [Aureimonas sp. SA4125]